MSGTLKKLLQSGQHTPNAGVRENLAETQGTRRGFVDVTRKKCPPRPTCMSFWWS